VTYAGNVTSREPMATQKDPLHTMQAAVEILRFIPKRGSISTQELVQRLDAANLPRTERAVQRWLKVLCESGRHDIEREDAGKPYRYRWKEGAKGFSVGGLSSRECLLLTLAEQQLGALLPAKLMKSMEGYFAEARSQLSEASPSDSEREWLQKVRVVSTTQPLLPPKVMPEVFQQVSDALYGNQWLDVVYQNAAGKKASPYRVMPLGLVQQGPRMYLACRFEGYDDNRSLAVHRIKSASATTLTFARPRDFDLKLLNDDMGFGDGPPKMIRLRFQIDKANGLHILECPLSVDQTHKVLPDGYVITATVADTEVLGRWLNGFGRHVSEISRSFQR